jgi:hypothetical protein
MDEQAVESTTVEEDGFDMSGWDDEVETEPAEDATEETGETEQETGADGADQPDGEGAGEDKPEETDAQPEPKPGADTLELKYMGETKTVGKEEAVVLAQKGLDYDRIRQERDSMSAELEGLRADKNRLTEYEDFLSALASSVNMDIPAMMDSTRAKMLVAAEKRKGNVITEDFALQRIKFEKEKAEFEKSKGDSGKQQADKPEEKPKTENTENEAAKARRNDEAAAFLKDFPEVDPKTIPKEVINQWMSGTPLSVAYMKYENQKLKAELAAEQQNQKNSKRTTGSSKTAGAGRTAQDPVFAGWDD